MSQPILTVRAGVVIDGGDIHWLKKMSERAEILHDIGTRNGWTVDQLWPEDGETLVLVSGPAHTLCSYLKDAIDGGMEPYFAELEAGLQHEEWANEGALDRALDDLWQRYGDDKVLYAMEVNYDQTK